jgi:hypothetical protein
MSGVLAMERRAAGKPAEQVQCQLAGRVQDLRLRLRGGDLERFTVCLRTAEVCSRRTPGELTKRAQSQR